LSCQNFSLHSFAPAVLILCLTCTHLQDTVQTVQALKGASSQMRGAMKHNKELDLNFIDNLQVWATAHAMSALSRAAIGMLQRVRHS
jgi:uncharacterized protein YifN (PemK superfamily)